ncbi:hypothetical protein PINS_up015561 [Pythium insidiosum]|nr:hypothetical protein PINS_up015561 [Pythium insidiosum]
MGVLSKRPDEEALQLDTDACTSFSIQLDQPLHEMRRSCRMVSDEDDDIESILLRAIEPPDHSRLSLQGTLRELKLSGRRKQAFKNMLFRVEMNVWTLRFNREYERAYQAYLYEHALPRIRYAMGIGLLFLLLKTLYEFANVSGDHAKREAWRTVLILHVAVALPVILIVSCCTLVRRLDNYCEAYASIPFLVITYILTAQKVLLDMRGPIFSMFLVMVPVFGITRFRFFTSLIVVSAMLIGHIGGLLCFQDAETKTDVLFQGYNYLGGMVVGVVCHYRAEVLRRRNYIMLLPFSDVPLDKHRMDQKLHDPQAKKHVLLSRWTLKFKNAIVEEAFYRHWYLIDACPFDHPNAGELHRTVYRTVRFAVTGVIIAQLMLVVQDWEYLRSGENKP